jgi:uncharacterized membrane protein YhaH (DUF805 family)
MRPASTDQLLRFFFRTEGRISRAEYALGLGFIYAVNGAILLYVLIHPDISSTALFLLCVVTAPLVVGIAVVMAKRCHDLGLPGTFFLLILVPLVGLVWLVALGFLPGNPGPNSYGAPPAFAPE